MIDTLPESKTLPLRQVVRWWELRRPIFNLVLLVVGFLSIAAMDWIIEPLLPEGAGSIEPVTVVLVAAVYGILVNGCYTLAWILELWESKKDAQLARERGRLSFLMVMIGSAIMASGPLWYGCAYWLMHRFGDR